MDNHKLRPSSAARRMACPGSWGLESKYPDTESTFAKEGTAAHWVATEFLEDGIMAALGTITPNGEPVTQEMIDGANLLAEDVKGDVSEIYVENFIKIPTIHELAEGTPDVFGFRETRKVVSSIHVWDYKFGHGYVDVYENWQLIEYCAGIISFAQTELKRTVKPETKVIFRIVQPRCYAADSIREWGTTVGELNDTYFPQLIESERQAVKSDAVCRPSPACNYCTARHVCYALQHATLRFVDFVAQNHANELTPAALSLELRTLQNTKKILDSRVDGLETEAISKIQRGEVVPRFAIEPTQGREKWDVEAPVIEALGKLYKLDLMKPVEPITPAQAVKKGLPVTLKPAYASRQFGSPKLVERSDKQVREIFTAKTK